MVIVSITRFRLRSGALRGQFPFFYHTLLSVRQASRAAGFLRGRMFADANRTYWTMTIWEDHAAARAFQKSGAHLRAMRAMPQLMSWCDEAATGHFEHTGDNFPSWDESYRQLVAHGRFLPLTQPSTAHTTRQIVDPQPDAQNFAIRRAARHKRSPARFWSSQRAAPINEQS